MRGAGWFSALKSDATLSRHPACMPSLQVRKDGVSEFSPLEGHNEIVGPAAVSARVFSLGARVFFFSFLPTCIVSASSLQCAEPPNQAPREEFSFPPPSEP